MKPTLFLSIMLVITIVIAASFGLSVGEALNLPRAPIYDLPDSVATNALYVCPTANSVLDEISQVLVPAQRYMVIAFFFFLMLIFAFYAFALYQNLLADKYEAKQYKNAWFLAKTLFWATVVATILLRTPNNFRTVQLQGADGHFVLCESSVPGARPVRADAVILHSKIVP